jgi:hypothetical protein
MLRRRTPRWIALLQRSALMMYPTSATGINGDVMERAVAVWAKRMMETAPCERCASQTRLERKSNAAWAPPEISPWRAQWA